VTTPERACHRDIGNATLSVAGETLNGPQGGMTANVIVLTVLLRNERRAIELHPALGGR
jgi:hypothetical protein